LQNHLRNVLKVKLDHISSSTEDVISLASIIGVTPTRSTQWGTFIRRARDGPYTKLQSCSIQPKTFDFYPLVTICFSACHHQSWLASR